MAKSDIEKVRREMFGGTLAQQGRGFYVTLEFLAVAKGVDALHEMEESDSDLLTRNTDALRYVRRGHDVARRLAHQTMSGLDGRRPSDQRLAEIAPSPDGSGLDTDVINWVGSLFAELTVPRPNARAIPDWGGLHLYPYVGEMIHYDAVYREPNTADFDEVSIERYLYRGGGALAYEIVRADPDPDRRDTVAAGLHTLVSDSGSPLGRIAAALAAHEPSTTGRDKPRVFEDPSADYRPDVHKTEAAELMRAGLSHLLSARLPRPKTMELLMHWLPFTLARHQLEIALLANAGRPGPDRIPVEFVPGTTPLRRLARAAFDQRRRCIATTVTERLLANGEPDTASKAGGEESAKFYSSTLATIGHLNANTGLRHFVIRNPLLEAIVFALVPTTGLDFDEFCNDILGDQLGFIIGERSPDADTLLAQVDNGLLRANQSALQDRLEEIGLLENLSDATKRVEARS